MARVLVTGANGHIGSNTVRSLLRQGNEVVAFVRRNAVDGGRHVYKKKAAFLFIPVQS